MNTMMMMRNFSTNNDDTNDDDCHNLLLILMMKTMTMYWTFYYHYHPQNHHHCHCHHCRCQNYYYHFFDYHHFVVDDYDLMWSMLLPCCMFCVCVCVRLILKFGFKIFGQLVSTYNHCFVMAGFLSKNCHNQWEKQINLMKTILTNSVTNT